MSFSGCLDDVRVYSRAISDSEIQQLYSLPSIGTVPIAPIVVQTNRTPTSAELGNKTMGVLQFLTNGVFTNVGALDPNKETIVLTHGWIPTLLGGDLQPGGGDEGWPLVMAETMEVTIGSSAANIVAWNWPTDAARHFMTLGGRRITLRKRGKHWEQDC